MWVNKVYTCDFQRSPPPPLPLYTLHLRRLGADLSRITITCTLYIFTVSLETYYSLHDVQFASCSYEEIVDTNNNVRGGLNPGRKFKKKTALGSYLSIDLYSIPIRETVVVDAGGAA